MRLKEDLSDLSVSARFVRFAGLLDFSDYSVLSDLSISEFQKKKRVTERRKDGGTDPHIEMRRRI